MKVKDKLWRAGEPNNEGGSETAVNIMWARLGNSGLNDYIDSFTLNFQKSLE